jgi:hypothetical protein
MLLTISRIDIVIPMVTPLLQREIQLIETGASLS